MFIYANLINKGNFCPPEDQQASAMAYQTADITQTEHVWSLHYLMKCQTAAMFQLYSNMLIRVIKQIY